MKKTIIGVAGGTGCGKTTVVKKIIENLPHDRVMMITHDVDEAVLLSDRIVMMTNGPAATIGEILEVKLPRPRNRLELADNPDYNHYRAHVLHFLYERQKHKDAA